MAAKHFKTSSGRIGIKQDVFVDQLRKALWLSIAVTYAQGMAMLQSASAKYEYHTSLFEVARIWRGGCIIRSAMLEDIQEALQRQQSLLNLMLDPKLAKNLSNREMDLRAIILAGIKAQIPVPAFSASLAYFDAYRSQRLPHNLLQAQRDFFGAHTYERIDQKGTFHTHWERN